MNNRSTSHQPTFGQRDVECEERQVVYQGFFAIEKIALKHRLFAGGWSKRITRELLVRGTAVAAVIYDPTHRLIGLVEQFRVGLLDSGGSPWCREVVAGMAEPNEADEAVVLRELQEEAGIQPYALKTICEYYSSPGGTDERLMLYCACADLSQAVGLYGLAEENEDIRLLVLAEDDVFSTLYDGQYNNAATLICLQWLITHKHQLSLTEKTYVAS